MLKGRRPETAAWQHLYATQAWKRLRQATLVRDLFTCQRCGILLSGRPPAPHSPVVNHRTAHKGDTTLFFDEANVEAVCKSCHDGAVKFEEGRGYSRDIGADGWPTSPAHPANRVKA